MEEKPTIYIPEDSIERILQFLFDHTEWGIQCGGYLPIEPEEIEVIIKEFKRKFPKDPTTNEYAVEDFQMFNFINDQVYQLIENTMLQMVDAGIVELRVDKDGEICFSERKYRD